MDECLDTVVDTVATTGAIPPRYPPLCQFLNFDPIALHDNAFIVTVDGATTYTFHYAAINLESYFGTPEATERSDIYDDLVRRVRRSSIWAATTLRAVAVVANCTTRFQTEITRGSRALYQILSVAIRFEHVIETLYPEIDQLIADSIAHHDPAVVPDLMTAIMTYLDAAYLTESIDDLLAVVDDPMQPLERGIDPDHVPTMKVVELDPPQIQQLLGSMQLYLDSHCNQYGANLLDLFKHYIALVYDGDNLEEVCANDFDWITCAYDVFTSVDGNRQHFLDSLVVELYHQQLTLLVRYASFSYEIGLRQQQWWLGWWKHKLKLSLNLLQELKVRQQQALAKRTIASMRRQLATDRQQERALHRITQKRVLDKLTLTMKQRAHQESMAEVQFARKFIEYWQFQTRRIATMQVVADHQFEGRYLKIWGQHFNFIQDQEQFADQVADDFARRQLEVVATGVIRYMQGTTLFDPDDDVLLDDRLPKLRQSLHRFQFRRLAAMLIKWRVAAQLRMAQDELSRCRLTNQMEYLISGKNDLDNSPVSMVVKKTWIDRWRLLTREKRFVTKHSNPQGILTSLHHRTKGLIDAEDKLHRLRDYQLVMRALSAWTYKYNKVYAMTTQANRMAKTYAVVKLVQCYNHQLKLEEMADEFLHGTINPRLVKQVVRKWREAYEIKRQHHLDSIALQFIARRCLRKLNRAATKIAASVEQVSGHCDEALARGILRHWHANYLHQVDLRQTAEQFDSKKYLKLWYDEYVETSENMVAMADELRDVHQCQRFIRAFRHKSSRLKDAELRGKVLMAQLRTRAVFRWWWQYAQESQRVREGSPRRDKERGHTDLHFSASNVRRRSQGLSNLRVPLLSSQDLPTYRQTSKVGIDVSHSSFLSTPIKSQPRRSRRSPEKQSQLRQTFSAIPTGFGLPPPKPIFPMDDNIDRAKRLDRIQPIEFPVEPTFDLTKINRYASTPQPSSFGEPPNRGTI